jgi:hypothetical protein
MMKRHVLVLCAVLALAAGVTAASASNGSATPFKVSVPGYSCSGSHVVNSQVTKDSETCVIPADSLPPGRYASSPCPAGPNFGYGCIDFGFGPEAWYSDYFYFVSPGGLLVRATSWTLTVKASHNGSQTTTVEAIF